MDVIKSLCRGAVLLGTAALTTPVAAQTTYSNVAGAVSNYIGTFGSGRNDVPIQGQTFTAPTGNLLSWTFYNGSDAVAGETFEVAAWNGTTVVGPILFSAASNVVAPDPANGGFYAHTVSGINLALTAGQTYLAFDTTNGVASPLSGVYFEGANTSPLGGSLAVSSSTGTPVGAAYNKLNIDLTYSATFGAVAAAVPEATTWSMMIAGIGLVGFALRRRPASRAASVTRLQRA